MPIEISDKVAKILKAMEETQNHFFITGNAGTGKSTLLSHFRNTTKKNLAVVAPTGVAAVNVKGETIHSFFKIPPSVTPQVAREEAKKTRNAKLYRALQILIIDEISMVRADLLDSIDIFLKTVRHSELPFGGVQMIMVGDLYQLPPVVTNDENAALSQLYSSPFFFSSKVMSGINDNLFNKFYIVELDKIYRQSDAKFINILNNIRTNKVTEEDLNALNRQLISEGEYSEDYIILTSVNAQADIINQTKLAEIIGTAQSYHATITGDFGANKQPLPDSIALKTGAKIMLLNNDPDGRWINGTVGRIYSLKPNSVTVKLENGEIVDVTPFTWSSYKTSFNQEKNVIESLEVGSFKQMPIKLAWAITIHKSQGKTFEKVIIDFGRGAFAHGQTYVALSRCTSLSGIKLLRPINQSHIILDKRIEQFVTDFKDCVFEVSD